MDKKLMEKFPNLTKEQMTEYRDAFTLFDADGNGTIETEELLNVMNHLGGHVHYQLADVEKMIRLVDDNGDGKIDFGEFVELMTKSHKSEKEELRDAFNVFDKDGDGCISKKEISEVLNSLGQTLTDQELDLIMKYVDTDNNGTVDFDEFCQMMSYGPPKSGI
eukprot:c9636_g1_i1.p1 GENE.c9636_g1_i1~~c9636_g1_i1.p1  ORF type:complete len:183 (+),score=65.82 c9636_g1_i1:61-549(+)